VACEEGLLQAMMNDAVLIPYQPNTESNQ